MLASFVFYLQSFFDPIQSLSQLYTTYQAGMAALDKIFELLDEEPDMADKPDAVELPRVRGEIRFDRVTFSYGGEALALDEVTLDVPPGQTLALVGATGAGKSTLAKLVARFYDPDEGRVLIDGHDLRDVTERSLRSQLGIVPQESFLFSGTIRDNIAFGRPDATDEDVEAAAQAVGAHDFIERLPDGYDTEVGERGGHLSAGQRQLVAFARAAAADPRILILDEATSNVDVRTESQIERGLRRLLAGRTAIVIAHRLSTIRERRAASSCSTTAASPSRARTRSCSTPTARTRASTATGRSSRPPDAGYPPRREEALSGPGARGAVVLPAARRRDVTMTDFKVEPASKHGGGHPNVDITQEFSYDNTTDSVKDAFVRLQPGLLGNPQSAAFCSQAQFSSDTCPADSTVGSVVVDATAYCVPLSRCPHEQRRRLQPAAHRR